MKRECRIVSLLILAAAVLPCRANAEEDFSAGLFKQEEIISAAKSITAKVYPDADDVVVANHERIRYKADGSAVNWEDSSTKILTEKGKREMQTISVWYNVIYSTAAVKRLEIIKPSGAVVPVAVDKLSREMIDQSQMAINIYDPNNRILQVSVPGLEIGDVLRAVTWEYTRKAHMPNTWCDLTVAEHTMPIKHMVYEVFGPAALPLKHYPIKAPVGKTLTFTSDTQAGTVHYIWVGRDVPQMFDEPRMPTLYTVVQRVLTSTISDWQTISRWYWNLSKPHLDAVTPEMSNQVASIVGTAATEAEKIERIFKWTSQTIRYMGITTETEAPGMEPHDVKITFNNKYGVCRDKAALLVALLRIAGLKGYPVLIMAGPKKDPDVPQPFFNHAITAVENKDGSYTLMDSTDENTKELFPAYLGDKSYLVCKPEGDTLRTSPISPAEQNLVRIETTGTLNQRGDLTAESSVHFDGINDNVYRSFLANAKPEERKRLFEGMVKRVAAGAKLTQLTIEPEDATDRTQPLVARLKFSAKDTLITGTGKTMLTPPWVGMSVGLINWILGDAGLEKRKYPFDTEVACGVRETFTLDLQDAVGAVVSLPEYTPIKKHTVDWTRTVKQDGGTLKGESEFLMKVVEFSPAEYLDLKETLRTIEFNNRKRPIFSAGVAAADESAADEQAGESEYTDAGGEDIEIQVESNEYTVFDAHTWNRTQTVRKEVKTYAGKKQNAELKIPYNPAWETVRIVDAHVTDPQGEEKRLGPQEINIMDQPWVGAAPRYPAGKTLVASLPAVDVGSVIDYTIVQTASNQPFFALQQSFNGFNPIVEKTVRLSAPAALPLTVVRADTGDLVHAQTATESGRAVYEWASVEQRGVKREDDLPPWWTFNPSVFVSGGKWSAYAAAVSNALIAAAQQQPASMAKAAEIIRGVTDPAAQAKAIRDYVATHVRPVGPNFSELPFSAISKADRVLADGYGNTTDRAVLLYSMLAAAGLKPAFVLAASAPLVESARAPLIATPQRAVFDSVLVRVALSGETVYLNDSDQYAVLGATEHDRQLALEVNTGLIAPIGVAKDKETRTDAAYAISVSESGSAEITKTITYRGGDFAAFHRKFAELPPEERRRYFQEAVADISQLAKPVGDLVTKYDTYPGIEKLTVTIEKFAVRDGSHLYFSLPINLSGMLNLRSDTRDNPLYWDTPLRFTATATVALPEKFPTRLLVPPDLAWSAPEDAGTISVRSTASATDPRSFTVTYDVALEPAIIPAERYADVLDINRRLSHPRMHTILLEQAPGESK